MKKQIIWAIPIFLLGCIKEQSTNYTARIVNSSMHNITILFFKNGIVYKDDTIRLKINEEIEIANGTHRGLLTGPGFSSRYFGAPNDSNIVIFDNLYKVSHYANTPVNLSSKYHINTSLRNIANAKSYKFQSNKVSKYANRNTHEYTFTEEDYLYAK